MVTKSLKNNMTETIIQQLVLAFITFLLGNLSGYFLHDFFQKSLLISENMSKNFVLMVVSLIWATSMVVGLLNPTYQVPLAVHGLMGAIVGFFFYKPNSNNGDKP